jgi:hypothetical protein
MYNPDTDLLFPLRVLPTLRDLRSEPWRNLIDSIISAGPDSLEQMSFILMMARMNNCGTCNSDSYRALNGCSSCTSQSLKRSHESDEVLIVTFHATRREVEQYLYKKNIPYQGEPFNLIEK